MACWDKECDSFIVPSWEPQWRLTLTESLHPHFHGRSRRGRSDGKKLSISSTSRTLIGRLGAPSINVLTRSDTPPVCAPFQQTPSPHNVWRTEHTKLGATSPPCSSTSSCSTYGRSQYLKETVFLATSRRQILLPTPAPEDRNISRSALRSRSSYSTLSRFSNVMHPPQFLHVPHQISQDLDKSAKTYDP